MRKIVTILSLCCICAGVHAQPGALDKNFANEGKFYYALNALPNIYFGAGYVVKQQPDGKILIAGYGVDYNLADYTQDFAIMRLNADGSIDKSFSDDGVTLVDFSTTDFYSTEYVTNIILQPDGKIVLSGYSYHYYYDSATDTYNYYDIAVARLNSDGILDNSFALAGKKLIDLSPYTGTPGFTKDNFDGCDESVLTYGGRIILAGYTNVYADDGSVNYDIAVVQLQANGDFDNDFDNDGIKILNVAGGDEVAVGAALQTNGLLVLGGYRFSYETYQADLLVTRLRKNGVPDNSFGDNGMAFIDALGPEEYGYSVAIQEDRKIVLSGRYYYDYYTAGFFLVRLSGVDGSLDNSFSDDGIQSYFNINESNYTSKGLVLQHDGKIIQVGGGYSNVAWYSGGGNFQVIRHNADGSLDSSFGNYGRSSIDFANWAEGINDFAVNCNIRKDGKVIVAGYSFGYIDDVFYDGISAAVLEVDGPGVSISAPPDQNLQAADGACGAASNDLDPIIYPAGTTATVQYELYGATQGSGTGTLSGKEFNTGTTTAVYYLADNPLNRASFNLVVTGGNNSGGGALDFDGIDDRVNLGYQYLGYTGRYSFEAWIKPRAYTNDDGFGSWIFGNERNINGGIQVQLDTAGYITTFHPSLGFVKSSYKVSLDSWTHIAFVQSSNDLKLYVNGNYVEVLLTAPYLHNIDLSDSYLLGAFTSDFTNYTRYFKGEMDEVRFWNKAICQQQIQNNLNCAIESYADGLVAYYKMNQGIAACSNIETAYLSNNYGSNGILENFALAGPVSNWVTGYVNGSCEPFSQLSIICPEPIIIDLDPGQCGINVDFSAQAVSGCGSNITLNYDIPPGSYFSAGTSYVYVSASDEFGNYTTCSFSVTVRETEPPVLVTKNADIYLDYYGSAYLNSGDVVETVSDNCGYEYWNMSVYPSYFNCANIGDNLVTVFVTDNSGNTTTGYANVTVHPYTTTATVEVYPTPVQYSDMAEIRARIINGGYYYNNGCIAPEVTLKLGDQVLGTVTMMPDYWYWWDLVGVLNKQMIPDSLFTGSYKLTAIFSGSSNGSISYNTEASARLHIIREDADIEYTESQLVTTACSTCEDAVVPFSAIVTDINDVYRGDLANASATITITPVTPGASVVGSGTINVPAITLLNNKHTSGILKGKFNVSTGPNKKARFDVSIQIGNYYKRRIEVPVYVTRGTGAKAEEFTSVSADNKNGKSNAGFDATAMPNPTHDHFSLKVQSADGHKKISLRIMDLAGRIIESKTGINSNEIIELGRNYKAGTYMVEVSQGQNKKLIKVVKL